VKGGNRERKPSISRVSVSAGLNSNGFKRSGKMDLNKRGDLNTK
jgi:hypothetical protein